MFKLVLAALLVSVFVGCSGGDDEADDASPGDDQSVAHVPTDAQMEALAKLQVPGYAASEAGLTLLGSGVTYTSNASTSSGAQIQVLVRMVACDDFICQSLDPKKYDGAEEQRNLKSVLPTAHIENPQLRWEFGALEFSKKATGLHTYALSYLETRGTDGTVSRSSTNSYFAWWHNESVFININVYPRGGDGVMSLGDLEKRMSKAEAEKALKEVFAVLEAELPKP